MGPMQILSNVSKITIFAFFITCSVFLIAPYEKPIFFNYAKDTEIKNGVMFAREEIKHLFKDIKITPNQIPKQVTPVLSTDKKEIPSTQTYIFSNPTPLWQKISSALKLDHYPQNKRVQAQIREILADKKSFETILTRSSPYLYYIYSKTQEKHLPAEIALIPIIESEFNPYDHSSVGAKGLWQLMPGTAKLLGVKIKNGYDGRLNVISSTNAAITFFNDLGKEFSGKWDLAFAAYNCGPGCIASAVKKSKSNDFFNLKIPLETKLYVPKLFAVAYLIKHAKEYGITLPDIKNAPYFKKVEITSPESLSHYASTTGSNLKLLKTLNPDYSNKVTSSLLVPIKY